MKGPDQKTELPKILDRVPETVRAISIKIVTEVKRVFKEMDSAESRKTAELGKQIGMQLLAGLMHEAREKVVGLFLLVAGVPEPKFHNNPNRDVPAEHRNIDD